MPVVFGEIKMSFWVRKKGQLAFSDSQGQLVNSCRNISFPRTLKVELSEQIHSS